MGLSVSALVFGGTMVGCTAHPAALAAISEAAMATAEQKAATSAGSARAALAAHKADSAVASAEVAVRWQPENAAYRVLLGQSYLAAGRFASARDAFSDALTLTPDDGRAALNLALAQTATGDWGAARSTLDQHAATIPAVDRGLAIALAGDPQTAVSILTDAARAPEADAKTRQNLALALALAGRWQESRAVAALDLGADEVDKRMEEWAAFAYPKSASQQVASLLGVRVVEDHGQPTALALAAAVPAKAIASFDIPVETHTELAVTPPANAVITPIPAEPATVVAAAEPAPVAETVEVATTAPVRDARPSIVFAARQEVVQAVPQQVAKPVRAVAVVQKTPLGGNYYVQLGAYENAAVAQDGWKRATRRYAAFADYTPQGMPVTTNGNSFYRLSVGGFARVEAETMCRAYRAKGGVCFVRVGQGDQAARWARNERQLASR